MKLISQFSLSFTFIFLVLLLSSCDKEEVPDLGDYMGTYEVTEGGCTGVQPKTDSYEVTVGFKGNDRTTLEIRNLWDDPQNVVEAKVSGLGFVIEEQEFRQFSSVGKITGQGTFSSTGIQVSSTFARDGGTPYSCTITGPKK